jgi:DNA sulfur modification protein DndD
MADQPEVDDNERRLQKLVVEATKTVAASFGGFRSAMRDQVQEATSKLFLRLTTEKDYSGVKISDDYLLSVVDDQERSLSMISAGANQILTMAFIGALAECSIEEAPMVMDTPFGRLDVGHRSGILDWVSTFDTQVILFVQSGEYDVERDAHLLSGKIGREFTIERLTPTRSLVAAA